MQVDSLPLEEETKEHGTGPLPPTLAMDMETPPEPLKGFHLMKLTGTEEYAGTVTAAKKALVANLLDVPERATSAGKLPHWICFPSSPVFPHSSHAIDAFVVMQSWPSRHSFVVTTSSRSF